jgi:peptide/nickel transport system ATP-binding protein
MSLLAISGLVRDYAQPRAHPFAPRRMQRVLHGVDLALEPGGSLGIVGESGSGKSTLARCVLALDRPQAGEVRLSGENLFALGPAGLRAARRHMQAIFQDPYGSLDPRHSVGRSIAEPLAVLQPELKGGARRALVAETLEAVGLPAASAARYPHEFSGGQRQRVAIARALVTRPALIVADEPVSALDVSVQAQVLNLMTDLQDRFGLAWLFISHDLGVVRCIADRVAVLLHGRVVEEGPTGAVFDAPAHPYTATLLAALPRADVPVQAIAPAGAPAPGGCSYALACRLAQPRCREVPPAPRVLAGRRVACHFA